LDKVKKATVAVAYLNRANAKEPFTIVGSGFCIDPSGIVIRSGVCPISAPAYRKRVSGLDIYICNPEALWPEEEK